MKIKPIFCNGCPKVKWNEKLGITCDLKHCIYMKDGEDHGTNCNK